MLFLLFILLNTPLTLSCTLSTGVVKTNPGEGDLCAECSYQGYYLGTTCYCILPSFDPSNACLPVVSTFYENITDYNQSIAQCECYENWENGFFKLSTPEKRYINGEREFVYGEGAPPICDDCYSELYGPNPREMTASRLVLGGLKPCTQYGGPDPNLIPTLSPVSSRMLLEDGEFREWRACNNHGGWNFTLRGCQCDLGWGLNYIGDGYNGEVFSCNKCIGPWGPPTPPFQDAIQNIPFAVFCSVPWTPDPEDGELKECSGHGTFQNGECVCDGNWALEVYNLTQETILLDGVESYTNEDVLYSVLTCITCKDGFRVEEGCGTFRTRSPTSIPSINPTTNPSKTPSKNPTLNPSRNPTLHPTKNPSRNPTLKPTRNPTFNPTLTPSKNPTLHPTLNPSRNPTLNPTKNPSRNPTFNPTKKPSKNPTRNPTLKPTLNPSHNPTLNPTTPPTRNPSLHPTSNPTLNPSLTPTKNPSENPTINPTSNPTKKPTSNPTLNPSLHPTHNPSVNPTLNPTRFVGSLKFYENPYVNNGNKGGKGVMDTQCALEAISLGLDCIFTTALLSTSSALVSDFPVKYAFAPTTPVYSGTNVKIANSWDEAFNTGLLLNLNAAGAIRYFPGNPYFVMGNYSGNYSASNYCFDWTSSLPGYYQVAGLILSTTVPDWYNSVYIECGDTTQSLCLCTSPEIVTSSPTKNPTTREPTKDPTKSPSFNPTRNPSRNPSKNPTRNPTKNPTKNPTRKPTRDPTKNPTSNPTRNPTQNPTQNPTKKPTSDPTKNPTKNPTPYSCLGTSVSNCDISIECDCGYDCIS